MDASWKRLGAVAAAVAISALALTATAPAHAAPAVAAGFRVGTLGLGGEATIGLNSRLNLRVPFNLFTYTDTREEDGVDYDGKLKLKSLGAQLDFHPFKGSFYLSAGLFSNGNQLKLHASDDDGSETYDIGDREYTSDPNDPLNLNGKFDFKSTAPYLGLGWGNPIQGDGNFYFRFELGAYFQGAARVGLRADGSAIDTQSGQSFDVNGNSPEAQVFQQNLEQERSDLEHDASDFKIYPAVSFALGYRFSL